MGSLAVLLSRPNSANNASDMHLPDKALAELNDVDYLIEVLQTDNTSSEEEIAQELIQKAAALGISTTPVTPIVATNRSADSDTTTFSTHARNTSTGSNDTTDTALSSHPSSPTNVHFPASVDGNLAASPRARPRSLNFSHYEKYLAQVEPNLNQPKFLKQSPPPTDDLSGLFSINTRKSVINIKNGIKAKVQVRWKKRSSMSNATTISCICCRDDFSKQNDLQTLPCGHTYCGDCLRTIISQATTDESKMPPRCCTQPIPGSIIKPLLTRDDQQCFLKAVQEFSTPWEKRIFCPNPSCNEFIPPRPKPDPKHPFDGVCRECRTRVCTMCKMRAHPLGQDCPNDLELDQVLRMGEKSGWRRCYKCRTLVELSQGCTHMTCRCKAQFCYICGAIWDPAIGCPNICNGEEELERRRREEAEREAELEAEKAAQEAANAAEELERQQAENRTEANEDFKKLKEEQEAEMQRFLTFEGKTKLIMWARHHDRKISLNEKYSDQTEKMRERHAKTEQHLDERQIAAEIELRASLEQTERSIRIRVKHMEAYCKALGRTSIPVDVNMPPRVVTERHLRELRQQHSTLEGMARLHQSRINVLRDRQAKRMEELLERQEKELEKLEEKREEDIEDLAARFAHEEDALTQVFADRKSRLVRRWELAVEILRVQMEAKDKVKYAAIPMPKWPAEPPVSVFTLENGALGVVKEENEGCE